MQQETPKIKLWLLPGQDRPTMLGLCIKRDSLTKIVPRLALIYCCDWVHLICSLFFSTQHFWSLQHGCGDQHFFQCQC